MKHLEETVTVKRPVPSHIADMVNFAKYLHTHKLAIGPMTDDDLIKAARDFWDTQHGED